MQGGGFAEAGGLLLLAGFVSLLPAMLVRRLRVVLPNEVAGVVVMLIGVALAVLGAQRLGLYHAKALPGAAALEVLAISLAVMVATPLSRTRLAPFAVLVGAAVGWPRAWWTGQTVHGCATILAAQAWLAWPRPWLPRFDAFHPVMLLAFLVPLIAIHATAVGSLVVAQRGSDADWSRPDAAPIRRGLLANALAMMGAGAIGGACPGPATAALGISVATGTLARRIAWAAVAMLLVVAMSPKVLALAILMPEPIKAAMLFYVAGFIMAQGSQLVTARMLDTRRMLVVALGLCAGIVSAVAPKAFAVGLPALASPLSAGALVAFAVNLLTLPLVARNATLDLSAEAVTPSRLHDWFDSLAASWALKPQTARAVQQSLPELVDLLRERGARELRLGARAAEDRVELTLGWLGAGLPEMPDAVNPEDLLGPDDARHRFQLWMAIKHAQGHRRRTSAARQEIWLAFDD